MADGTILVVDDDPAIVKLLLVNFELGAYLVVTATDRASGLARARERRPLSWSSM